MCGICGIYSPDKPVVDSELLRRVNASLHHRGPDGEGYFIENFIGLAMRRLAIIDLVTGNQPIFNEDRSVAVVFNGEIYNYTKLRYKLQRNGHVFTTQSDTEVLVHGYEEWADNLPSYLNGMFAFAIWDMRRYRLLLARDHVGIKPLYYAPLDGGGLAFASELKSLLPIQGWQREIDPLALDWFLATRYIPAPRSIYLGVRKLPPACRLTIGLDEPLKIERYWDFSFTAEERDGNLWAEQLRETLTAAVRRQMVADVPIGAFLSGGIDSSIIVGLMAQATSEAVRTFTVVFPRWDALDESRYASQVAARFATTHTEIAVEANVAQEWTDLAQKLDEPFADPATLPTWLMARQTRQHVTVVLTGEGSDELFQGYGWYSWSCPLPLPSFLARPLRRLVQYLLSGRRGKHRATALLAQNFNIFYAESILSSISQAEERLAWYRPEWRSRLTSIAPQADVEELIDYSADFSSRIQALDLKLWLEGDPLVKADRATMLASLEARVPFLDRETIELVVRIPPRYLHHRGVSKWILRQAFADLLPEIVLQRSKHAFEVPIGRWLRGPLRPMLEHALSSTSPLWHIVRPLPIQAIARAHLTGQREYGRELWTLMHLAFWGELYGAASLR